VAYRADQLEPADPAAPATTLLRFALLVPDLATLTAVGRHPVALARVHQVWIEIARWRAPTKGWIGRLGPIQEVRHVDLRVPTMDGRVRVMLELAGERPLQEVLAAVESLLRPGSPLPMTHSVALGSQGRLPAWLPIGGDVAMRFVIPPGSPLEEGIDPITGKPRGPEDPPPNRPAVDGELVMGRARPTASLGLVATAIAEATDEGVIREVVAGQAQATSPDTPVLVDVRGHRRTWTPPTPTDPHVVVEMRRKGPEGRWRLLGPQGESMGPWQALATPLVAAPTPWWSIAFDIDDRLDAAPVAAAVVRAALTGVVVDGRRVPPAVRARLAPELASIIAEDLPPTEDPLAWERRSVRQRRAAVRGHGTPFGIDAAIRPDAAVPALRPSVSALLVTRRPGLAVSVLRAIEHQTYPELEIVVAVHGVPQDPALEAAIAASERPIELVMVPAEATFGEALAIATARSRGGLLVKFDDDDIYGPEHVWDLVVARAISGADMVGKAAQFVWLERQGVTIRRGRPTADIYGKVVAGGTILVGRGELEDLGGWRPVRSGVDRALLDRALQAGGTIYQAWPFGYIYCRHGDEHTWDVSDDYFLRDVLQRWDGIPDLPEFRQPEAP
jgi:hypothetical protein